MEYKESWDKLQPEIRRQVKVEMKYVLHTLMNLPNMRMVVEH